MVRYGPIRAPASPGRFGPFSAPPNGALGTTRDRTKNRDSANDDDDEDDGDDDADDDDDHDDYDEQQKDKEISIPPHPQLERQFWRQRHNADMIGTRQP